MIYRLNLKVVTEEGQITERQMTFEGPIEQVIGEAQEQDEAWEEEDAKERIAQENVEKLARAVGLLLAGVSIADRPHLNNVEYDGEEGRAEFDFASGDDGMLRVAVILG